MSLGATRSCLKERVTLLSDAFPRISAQVKHLQAAGEANPLLEQTNTHAIKLTYSHLTQYLMLRAR